MSKIKKGREALARRRAVELLGGELEVFANPLTVLASPAWRGVEGDIWRAGAGGKTIVLKHYHRDTEFYVSPKGAIDAARLAGASGVGPKVLGSWADEGLVAFEDLAEPWRAGGLHVASSAAIRSAVIERKKAFQTSARLDRDAGIFDDIETLYAKADHHGIATHKDSGVFMSFFRDARSKIASLGQDSLPCHRDGNTANLMIGPDNSLKLIDFDLAANCDPFEDIGCYLIEFFESDGEARAGFEEWYGRFDEGLFQRAMLYGLADDMRWALIGSIMGALSPRRSLEFAKYAAWRFLRLERHAKRSDANDRIRIAA